MKFSKYIGSLLMAAVMMAPSIGLAQNLKIGVVDVARLLQESPQAQGAMASLQDEFAPRQREIVAKQNEFQDKQSQVQRDLEVMGPEERRNAERDLRSDEREILRLQEEFREDLDLRRNEELAKMQQDLFREIQSFASAGGYDLIVGEGVLYASSAVDVTDLVLQGMQQSAGGTTQ